MQRKKWSEEVKVRTRSSHQALESYLVKIIRQIDSLEDYKKLLLMFYGYYQPVEKLIGMHLDTSFSVPAETRNTERLLSDINQIAYPPDFIPLAAALPVIENHIQAIAALYVLEGSTLGGKYILQMIRKKIHLPEGGADGFLSGHGTNTELNWKCFKDYLDEEINEADEPVFMVIVNDTFDRFNNWAKLNYQYVEQEKL